MERNCEQLKQDLSDLEQKKQEFDLELEKAIQTGDFERVRQLKQELEKDRDSLKEKLWFFEYIERAKIKEQYESEIEAYREIGLLETLSNGQEGIKDEQGNEHPIPTLKEVEQRIKENRDLCEQKFALMQNARIHLVPFALSPERLAQLHNNQIQEYKDKGIELLDHEGKPVELRDDSENVFFEEALKNLEYYPEWEEIGDEVNPKNGISKEQALEQIGAWKVMIIEDIPITHQKEETEPVIEKPVTIKRKKETLSREKPKGELNAAQQYDILKQQQEQGFTLEDWISFSMVHLKEKKIVLDDSNQAWCRCLGNNTVGGHVSVACWFPFDRQVVLGGVSPHCARSFDGFRPGVILKKP